MAYGIEQQIGTGQAQVFPRGKGYGDFVNDLNQQRQYQFQRERQTKLDQEKKSNELYSLIGNELNPRDFNAVIHYKVQKAQQDLASQIITNPNMDYGQMYLQAHNKAAELGQTSDTLNRLDQQIALTRKEYEGDRRLNMGVAELAARKKILDKIQNGEKLDESVNYIDEALNDPSLQKSLLTDNSNYVNFDLKAHKMDDLTGSVRKRVAGRTTAFNYNVDNIPAYYSVTPGKSEYDEPAVNTNSETITDASGNKIPILSKSAYDAVKLQPSNVTALNNIIQDKYGKGIDLRSEKADMLRRQEAYNMLEQQKPKVNSKRSELQPININTGNNSNGAEIKDAYAEISDKVHNPARPNGKLPLNELTPSTQGIVLSYANKLTGGQLTQADIYVAPAANGDLSIFRAEDSKLIAPIDFGSINVQAQVNAKAKAAVIKQANQQGMGKLPATRTGAMVTVTLPDGRKGQIPESNVESFLKENPGSKRQ